MHRTSGGHRTIDVTTGLSPATFGVPGEIPQHYRLTWDQFATRSMVENITRDVGDQFVAKGETENMSRGAESTETQRRKTMRQTFHSPLHQGSIAINQSRTAMTDETTTNCTRRTAISLRTFRYATSQAAPLMTPDRFHSPTRSPASISSLGDHMTDGIVSLTKTNVQTQTQPFRNKTLCSLGPDHYGWAQ